MGAYKKGLILQIGPILTTVDLTTVVPSNSKQSAKRVCPEHTIPLKLRNVCPEDEATIPWGQWDTAIQTPDGWHKVKADEKPSLEASSDSLELTPVPAKDIADNTLDGESFYWVTPTNDTATLNWTILLRQMKTGKTAFVTRGGFRKGGKEKLWKLALFRGRPVLRELVFPDTIRDAPEAEEVKVDKETSTMVNQFIESRMSSWSDMDTVDRFQAQIEAWMAAGQTMSLSDSSGEERQPHESMMEALAEAVKKNTQ